MGMSITVNLVECVSFRILGADNLFASFIGPQIEIVPHTGLYPELHSCLNSMIYVMRNETFDLIRLRCDFGFRLIAVMG